MIHQASFTWEYSIPRSVLRSVARGYKTCSSDINESSMANDDDNDNIYDDYESHSGHSDDDILT